MSKEESTIFLYILANCLVKSLKTSLTSIAILKAIFLTCKCR